MDTLALLSHGAPTAVIAYRSHVPVTAQRFLSDASHLAQRLPPGRHVAQNPSQSLSSGAWSYAA